MDVLYTRELAWGGLTKLENNIALLLNTAKGRAAVHLWIEL